ncbi:hypothetical protein EXIGLDRAFT_216656 [Exidia glandulosa HHB12029]|uniref:Uncharacterized protein n=1 Tax=Exidia glandulosa HHB12029 TaxID=1314781 RepID=A0A165EFJ4_EXIGL|nr:hypothetical protein EXIGLDRAFT_216656 [Exidia glandulosa HHB12029]
MSDTDDFDIYDDINHQNQPDDNPAAPSTLLDLDAYNVAMKLLSTNPGTVFTLDTKRQVLVDWLWPATSSGALVQPKSLESIMSKYNIEFPFCLCIYDHNGDRIGRPTALKKIGGTLRFVCRLNKRACGYSVSLDQWNSERTIGRDVSVLAGARGESWREALISGNAAFMRDAHKSFYGAGGNTASSSSSSGKAVSKDSATTSRHGIPGNSRSSPYPSVGRRSS